LAASITQGLAFAAGVPVVPISDLRAVAQRAAGHDVALQRVLVCNDARMQEVYWGCFERGLDGLMLPVGTEQVTKSVDVQLPDGWAAKAVSGAGRGFAAYTDLCANLSDRLTRIDADVLPGARDIAVLAVADVRAGRVHPPESAVPVYVRNEVARPKAP